MLGFRQWAASCEQKDAPASRGVFGHRERSGAGSCIRLPNAYRNSQPPNARIGSRIGRLYFRM